VHVGPRVRAGVRGDHERGTHQGLRSSIIVIVIVPLTSNMINEDLKLRGMVSNVQGAQPCQVDIVFAVKRHFFVFGTRDAGLVLFLVIKKAEVEYVYGIELQGEGRRPRSVCSTK